MSCIFIVGLLGPGEFRPPVAKGDCAGQVGRNCSLFNVQLSFVIGGCASRNFFLKMPRRRRIRQMTIEH